MPGFPDLQPSSERDGLEQHVEHCRELVVARIVDLTDEQAAARPLARTDLSVGGVVKHLAYVEDRWFVGRLLGEPLPEPWASHPDPAWAFGATDPVADLVALYAAACDRSRAAARGRPLDDLAAVPSFGKAPVSVRWLLLHMVQETSWHLGHLDLLRDALGAPPGP